MAGGRPTDYKPEYCKKLLAHMSKGLSFESFGASVDVCKDTLYEWVKVHTQFSDAKRKGELKSLSWWEETGREGLYSQTEIDENGNRTTKTLNSAVWIFNMKNRHKWRDRHDVDVKTEDVSALKKLSMAELKELVKKNLKDEE